MSNIIYKALRYSGAAWLWRETVQRGKVTILLFHDMEADDAERNLTYLKRHYNIISLQEYLQAVQTKSRLPRKALVITFDDGHASNYALLPVLQRLEIPITIFLCSEIVGTQRHFWFRHSEEMKPQVESLKRLTNQERLRRLEAFGFGQETEYSDRQALNDKEIKEMTSVVNFQSHTCFHPILPQCNETEARHEIIDSKHHLEERYGMKINTLSYPNGDYSMRDIQMAQEAGYTCGITVDSGYNSLRSDLFRLKRFSVNDAHTTEELMVKACGLYALIKHKLHKPSYGFKPSLQ